MAPVAEPYKDTSSVLHWLLTHHGGVWCLLEVLRGKADGRWTELWEAEARKIIHERKHSICHAMQCVCIYIYILSERIQRSRRNQDCWLSRFYHSMKWIAELWGSCHYLSNRLYETLRHSAFKIMVWIWFHKICNRWKDQDSFFYLGWFNLFSMNIDSSER